VGRMGVTFEPSQVNGEPGVIARAPDGSIVSVLSMSIADGQVISLRSVVNPDKLGHLGPTADLYAMLEQVRSI
jgi:hypothetical protein